MTEFRYDTQLLIEGENLDEDTVQDVYKRQPLGRASDGRIAGQIPDAVQREREQRRLRTQLRRGAGGFYSRVPCTCLLYTSRCV